MKKKIIAIGLISMLLLTGLSTFSAIGVEIKMGMKSSWIEITKPIEGSKVEEPITIECEGSDDVDEVKYAFFIDNAWYSSTSWDSNKPPYRFNFSHEDLDPGEEVTIHALAYNHTPNGHIIAEDYLTVSVKKSKSVNRGIQYIFEMFPNFYRFLQRFLNL